MAATTRSSACRWCGAADVIGCPDGAVTFAIDGGGSLVYPVVWFALTSCVQTSG